MNKFFNFHSTSLSTNQLSMLYWSQFFLTQLIDKGHDMLFKIKKILKLLYLLVLSNAAQQKLYLITYTRVCPLTNGHPL